MMLKRSKLLVLCFLLSIIPMSATTDSNHKIDKTTKNTTAESISDDFFNFLDKNPTTGLIFIILCLPYIRSIILRYKATNSIKEFFFIKPGENSNLVVDEHCKCQVLRKLLLAADLQLSVSRLLGTIRERQDCIANNSIEKEREYPTLETFFLREKVYMLSKLESHYRSTTMNHKINRLYSSIVEATKQQLPLIDKGEVKVFFSTLESILTQTILNFIEKELDEKT